MKHISHYTNYKQVSLAHFATYAQSILVLWRIFLNLTILKLTK